MSRPSVTRGSCHHDCPDTCMWEVTVVDGRAVQLRGSKEHHMTAGQLCPKVNRFLERVYHPDRLHTPLKRTGPKGSGSFEPIGWDTAIELVGQQLQDLVDSGRAASILQFSFDGTQGVIQKGILADRFFDAIGASDVRRHLCGVTAWLGAAEVSGLPYGIDPPSLAKARTIILWGTDTLVTNRHLWPFIEQARAAGAVVVAIDPVRTATAARADEFFQIRPGTDVALVLSLIHVLDRDGLLDPEWLDQHTTGWAELRASAQAWSPAAGAEETGLAAERIEWLANRCATVGPAAIRSLVGPEHRRNGRDIMRAIALLPAVTGAWRQPGGGLARSTQVYFETALNYPTDRPERRRFNMARLGQILTDSLLATPELDPPIDALVVHNSNPAVIVPDQNRVMTGLARPDLFTVVIEQFMTDTARYADIVLPATTQIEHLDLGIAWGHLDLSLNRPAIAPVGQAVANTEIFRRLARAMELDDPALFDSDEELIRQLLNSDHPWLDGISYERLAADGWARLQIPESDRPYVDWSPDTSDGRLQLGPLDHQPDPSQGHNGGLPTDDGRLALMSRKQHTAFLNANYGGFERHLPNPPEPRLTIHPVDAQARGITTGTTVVVANERGRLTMAADVSDTTQPGLVTIPFGWWHGSSSEGRAVNALTNPDLPPDEAGSAFFHDNLVDVTALDP